MTSVSKQGVDELVETAILIAFKRFILNETSLGKYIYQSTILLVYFTYFYWYNPHREIIADINL